MWLIVANCLPTKACLARLCDLDDILFPLCKDYKESSFHLFISCPFMRFVWFNSQWGLKLENLNLSSPSHLIGVFLNPPSQPILRETRGVNSYYLGLCFVKPFGELEAKLSLKAKKLILLSSARKLIRPYDRPQKR